jgi:hypothetical protein
MNVEIPSVEDQDQWSPDQKHLKVAKSRLAQAAFFGITERFQDSLFLLSFIFGWPPIIDSLHLNGAPGSDRLADLDPKTIYLIQSRVDLDTKLYNFGQRFSNSAFEQ